MCPQGELATAKKARCVSAVPIGYCEERERCTQGIGIDLRVRCMRQHAGLPCRRSGFDSRHSHEVAMDALGSVVGPPDCKSGAFGPWRFDSSRIHR